ncbi:sm_term_P27, putative phage terminase, small subunit, P27 family [uncultured Caudovirales phage]|jgi:P27 family predicted phage terminase small subunit|uniref:Sm_term_P27, putative phage terminase, small subunit, P27 family n=1 Tax=uncultured Caudovirales phage TaxID=2100421 RepID=A0A6J7X0U2_9CAUD|nr:sm_term_P27, putative phage terminase, small subunit, P27 family [uncultured Caudovirales phage]
MSGPAKTPNEIKARRGTLKPSRAVVVQIQNSLPRASELGVPDGLGPIATEAWERIVQYAGAWIAVSDRDSLTMLVKDIELLANLEARVSVDGPVLYTDKGYAYAHPAMGMRHSTEESIRKWMNHLGLTPADRAKLGIAMVESQSKVDKYRERLAAKAGHRAG